MLDGKGDLSEIAKQKNDRLKRVQELKNNSYEDLLKDSKKKSKLAKNFPQL